MASGGANGGSTGLRAVATLGVVLCAGAAAQEARWPLPHHHDHVQGLDVSDHWFWISAVDKRTKTGWVWRVDRQTLATAAERNLTDGLRYHAGGLQVAGDRLWIPLAEYRPNSSARILELDAMTLAERRSFDVPDHIGAVATDGETTILGANWDARKIYRWTPEGRQFGVSDFAEPLAIQDMKWQNGVLYAGGPGRDDRKGDCLVEELDPATLRVLRRLTPPTAPICYAYEAMAVLGGRFFFLPEDEPNSRIYSISSRSLKALAASAPR